MVNRKPSGARQPPSRVRYEKAHPTVTVRVDRQLYEELKKLKESSGQSVAGVLKIGLGKAQAAESKAYRRGYSDGSREGYSTGYEEAQEEFEVVYPCSVCGNPLSITHQSEKEAAARFMQEGGWRHAECHEGR